MSSILKALRKLEEEKARLHGGSSDIARDILRSPHRRKRESRGMTIIVACLSVVLAGGAGYFFRQEMAPSALIPMETAPAPSMREAADHKAPVIEGSGTVEKKAAQGQVMGPGIAEPEFNEKRGAAEVANRQEEKATAESPVSAFARTASKPSSLEAPPPVEPSVGQEGNPAIPTPREEASPELVLSGIAFQADRNSRMAIVNDLPVMEGMRIEGFLIEEILRDRVRVSSGDRTIELRMEEGPQ